MIKKYINIKSILLIIFLILIVNFTYVKLTSKPITVKHGNTEFFIKYLIVDKSLVSKDAKIDDIFSDKDTSEILYNSFARVYLTKKGTNYVGTLNNVNGDIKNNINDYVFALNDINGNVVDDAKFDIKTKEIVVPEKYYDRKNKYLNLHMQVMSRIDKNQIKNIKVKTYVNSKKKITYENTYEKSSKFSLGKALSANRIRKSDISIIINDVYKLSPSNFSWNYKANVVTLYVEPIIIDNVKIKVKKKSIVENAVSYIMNVIPVFAIDNPDIDAYKKISIPSNVHDSDWFNYTVYLHEVKDSNGKIVHHQTLKYAPYSSQAAAASDAEAGGSVNFLYGDGYVKDDYAFEADGSYNTSRLEDNWYENYETRSGTKALVEFKLKLPSSLTNTTLNYGSSESPVYPKIDFGTAAGSWIALLCGHSSQRSEGSDPYTIKITVLNITPSAREMTLLFEMPATANKQFGYGIYKFYWESNGKLNVDKVDFTKNNAKIETDQVTYKLYGKDNCSGSVLKTKKTTTGRATFTNLTCGKTYWIKETGLGTLTDNYTWKDLGQCISKEISCSGQPKDGYYSNTTNFPNRKRFYCLIAQKTDFENSSCLLNDITFNIAGTTVKTGQLVHSSSSSDYHHLSKTSSDANSLKGLAVLDMMEDPGNYSIQETQSGNSTCGSDTYEYWNDNSTATSKKAEEMTYDPTDGKYTCDLSKVNNYKDKRKYYCFKVKKVSKTEKEADGVTPKILPGASFKTTINGSEVEHADSWDGVNDGYTTFFTSRFHGTFSVLETVAPEGYSKNTELHDITVNVPLPEYDSETKAESACKAADAKDSQNNDIKTLAITVEDSKNLINFYKVTEDKSDDDADSGVSINGAKFVVRKSGTSSYVKFDGTETYKDDNNVTRTCYKGVGLTSTNVDSAKATSNLLYTAMNTQKDGGTSNGEVCITGLESETNYDIIEVLPSQYHAFGTQYSKTVTSATYFKDMDNTNKFINLPTYFEFDKTVDDVDGGDKQSGVIEDQEENYDDDLEAITTENLKKLDFQIFEANSSGTITNNTPLNFRTVTKNDVTVYEYDADYADKRGDNSSSILHLDDARKIRVEHLPWNTSTTSPYYSAKYYVIREVNTRACSGSDDDCIGYYYPDYTKRASLFKILPCTNDSSNKTSCNSSSADLIPVKATQSLVNVPTDINFTKRDFYHYEDAADKNNTKADVSEDGSLADDVTFEDDKERNDFDKIVFKLKEKNSNTYLSLVYMGNHGDCTKDSDYSEYRYVPYMPAGVSLETTEELHTCGGHIHITNLCRGKDYQVEEISVPADSVYVRENTPSTPTTVDYKIPCTEGEIVKKKSKTNVIDDKPTRVRFEKKDSKYGYLIPDETTTFEVYRCPKDTNGNYTECSPGSYSTVEEREALGMKLIKFQSRRKLTGTITEINENGNTVNIDRNDEEDGGKTRTIKNADGTATNKTETDVENSYEVYKVISDSDASRLTTKCAIAHQDNCYVTDLHPDKGILILRYLQGGYNYVLLETVAPKNYTLPVGTNAETPFKVSTYTVSVAEVDVPNKPTSVVLRKYDENGTLLPGAKFKVYEKKYSNGESKSCDPNLSAINQPRNPIKLKTIYEGIYEARENTDTYEITTCTNKLVDGVMKNCNEFTSTLVYDNTNTGVSYVNSWMGYSSSTKEELKAPNNITLNETNENYTQIQEGEALIQYLEYGHCYIFEETQAPYGYSLPEKEADRWTMITIEENDTFDHTTAQSFVNLPTPYQFFKYDEFHQLLDGAKFKLQKLNQNKIYEDITVRESTEKEEETKDSEGNITKRIYEVDTTTDNLTIETLKGTAFIYKLGEGQYRIVETEAAPGKELNKNPNTATFFVNKDGEVYGNRIITNKEVTAKIQRVMSDSAELIVVTRTGQTLIRYGLIIAGIAAGIIILMILANKKK